MWKILCTLLFVASSSPAWGQAMTVFGQTDGSHCYELSRDGYSPKQAIDICTRALKGVLSGSDRAYTLVNRSINYNLLGEYDEALEDIDAAFEIIPDLPEAYLSRGNTYFCRRCTKLRSKNIQSPSTTMWMTRTRPISTGLSHMNL